MNELLHTWAIEMSLRKVDSSPAGATGPGWAGLGVAMWDSVSVDHEKGTSWYGNYWCFIDTLLSSKSRNYKQYSNISDECTVC